MNTNGRTQRAEPVHETGGHRAGAASSLPNALDAPLRIFESSCCGRIAYYASTPPEDAGSRPLLLIHSINAAPSSYEVKPIFEHYRGRRRVFSVDLPGFGHSERSARRYSADLFADAIAELLAQVIGSAADVLALSLSAEFAARATLGAPDRVASLVLISPTGFSKRGLPSPTIGRIAHRALTLPLWGQGLFDLVASRSSIRYFLNRSFNLSAPPDLVDYAYATAHQPGARHAPLYFLSTQLFTPQACERLYSGLTGLPVLAIADRDPYVTFEQLPAFAASRSNWQYSTLAPHMGLPHWEHPEATFAALERFWQGTAP